MQIGIGRDRPEESERIMDTIRQLQARIDKLELELNRIAGMAEQGAKMCKSEFDKKGLLLIAQAADTALNTQPAPQAEWTPRRLVPTVRVKRDAFDADNRRGQVGVIVGSAADYFEIEFEDGITEGVKRSEVEPLTE